MFLHVFQLQSFLSCTLVSAKNAVIWLSSSATVCSHLTHTEGLSVCLEHQGAPVRLLRNYVLICKEKQTF